MRQQKTNHRLSTFSIASSAARSKTFYEGELTLKTGMFSKTKVFASILKDDASFYVIEQKLLPRINGQIKDRVDPYEDFKLDSEEQALAPGWTRFELKDCLVFPTDNDSKAFKLLVNSRNKERQAVKEHRFITPNVCARTIWVKKLGLAADFKGQGETFSDSVYGGGDVFPVPVLNQGKAGNKTAGEAFLPVMKQGIAGNGGQAARNLPEGMETVIMKVPNNIIE